MRLEGLLHRQGLHLGREGVCGAATLADLAEPGFDPLGERFAGLTLNPFHMLLDTAIGADPESDGALGHGRCRDGTDSVG